MSSPAKFSRNRTMVSRHQAERPYWLRSRSRATSMDSIAQASAPATAA